MSQPEQIKTKVKKLRAKGNTYTEILKKLGIKLSKGTISNWCKDVSLPKWYKEKIDKINYNNYKKARKIAWAVNKTRREKLLKEIPKNNSEIMLKTADKTIRKMLLSILYLGEGAKWKSHRGLMLGSADPIIIKLYITLLNLCYGVTLDKLKCRVSYRADQNIKKLEKYWSRTTSISPKNFYKTKPDPRTIGKPTRKKDYKGVCVVTCAGTHIQLELEKIPELILRGL